MPNTITRRPPFRRRGQNFLPLGPHISLRASVTGSGGVVFGSTATTSFEHKQVASDLVIECDWDNDGDFDQPEEDITSFVLAGQTRTGRDWPSQLTGKAGPGALRLSLRNDDDRFSYFNTDSPLNSDPFSLKTGRKIRVRTSDAGNPDPTLLARDRFRRSDGSLLTSENGLTWTNHTTALWKVSNFEAELAPAFDSSGTLTEGEGFATVDVGTQNYYAQVTIPYNDSINQAGLAYRFTDTSDFSVVVWTGQDAGTFSTIDHDLTTVETIQHQEFITLGLLASGTVVSIYLNGVLVANDTAWAGVGTKVGIYGNWSDGRYPVIDNFEVWSGLPTEMEGVLWTGSVSELTTSVEAGPMKLATITGEGPLAKLANVDISPPDSVGSGTSSFSIGQTTGELVGESLSKAGLLSPPGAIQAGEVRAGSVGLARGKALDIARQFEELEFGFLYETQEGNINFDSRTGRDSSYSRVTLSDTEGTQFAYEEITPYDWTREVVNQVDAGVSGSLPVYIGSFGGAVNNAAGVDTNVSILMPDAANGASVGDLFIVVVTPTVGPATGQQWIVPNGWTAFNQSEELGKVRIYAKKALQADLGATYLFYNDLTPFGGSYQYVIHVFSGWYGDIAEGFMVAPPVTFTGSAANSGKNLCPTLFPSWGKEATAFIAMRAGMTSTSGATVGATQLGPHGYVDFNSTNTNGTANAYDVCTQRAFFYGNRDVESPSAFTGTFTGFDYVENHLLAVRGFSGDPPEPSGVRTVTSNDFDSQDEHNAIRSHRNAANLFRNTADAALYGDLVLARYADDRPIFSIGFTATKSGAYRNQAKRRRINDRITLVADGNAGLGVSGDFFIESISHDFNTGTSIWQTRWELSPATDVMRADTDGSELGANINTTETVIQIDTITGQPWISSFVEPNMFPFNVRIGDEVIRLISNTVDPDNVSPQFYNVERSVNGVTQAHDAGASVSLADPWVLP